MYSNKLIYLYSNKLIYSSIYILVAGLEALCVQCDEKFKRCYLQVFTRKSMLYWVSTNPGSNRVCMKSHYLYWLVSQSCLLTSWLFLECGRLWTFSSVAAGAGAGRSFCCRYRCRSFCNFCCSASSTFSSFLSAKYRIGQRSILCCHEDKVW